MIIFRHVLCVFEATNQRGYIGICFFVFVCFWKFLSQWLSILRLIYAVAWSRKNAEFREDNLFI